MVLANLIFIGLAALFESSKLLDEHCSKYIKYDNVNLVHPAKRQELMQSRLTDAEKLKEAAAEEKANADMELRAMQNRVKTMIESAKDEANTEKERILEDAARQAEATLEKANATIEKQKAEMRKDIQREIVDVALAASTKLMGKDDLEEQDARALESFVKEISDESGR